MIQWIETKVQGRVYLMPSPDGSVMVCATMEHDADSTIDFHQVPVMITYVQTVIDAPPDDDRAGVVLGTGGVKPLYLLMKEAREFNDALEAIMPELSLYHDAWADVVNGYQGRHRDGH